MQVDRNFKYTRTEGQIDTITSYDEIVTNQVIYVAGGGSQNTARAAAVSVAADLHIETDPWICF